MMKNLLKYTIAGVCLLSFLTSCKKQLDLKPISSISDANYWQTADQFDAFVSGVHSRFRSHVSSFQTLGEMRSDIFGTEPGSGATFMAEATQGVERMWLQTLSLDAPGVSNFGGFYSNIVQLNLLISKLNSTNIVTPANKAYYLGIAYGMRAYYYFHLTRAWGDVVIQTDPVLSFDIANLSKAASPAADVMTLIKSDIESSLTAFGTNYTFRNTKSYWSKPATLMLKAEVFLWTAHRSGGTADATTALNALTDIQTNVTGISLLPLYKDVFAFDKDGNAEIIFSVRNGLNENSLPFATGFYPQTNVLAASFHDSVNARQFSTAIDNWGGTLRAPIPSTTFRKFDNRDSRKWFSIQGAYTKPAVPPAPGVVYVSQAVLQRNMKESKVPVLGLFQMIILFTAMLIYS